MNKQRARQKRKREFAASLAVKASPGREVNAPMFRPASTYTLETITPIFEQTVFEGAVTLLCGWQGCAKSLYALTMLAQLSREGQRSLIFSMEDSYAAVVKPRLVVAKANTELIFFGDENHGLNLPTDFEYLRSRVAVVKPRVLVLDMLDLVTPLNLNTATNVLDVLGPLKVLGSMYHFGIVCILHCSNKKRPTINTTLGSTKLPGLAKSALVIEEEFEVIDRPNGQKDKVKTGLKIVKHEKYNYTSKQPNQYFRVKEDEGLKTGYLVFESGPED